MTIHVWLNAVSMRAIELGELESPRWLRQLVIARRVIPGWSGALLG